MREIKFRGKSVDSGEWLQGDLIQTLDTWIHDFDHMDRITSETVGQFTDLKDENGVEIYEGDIVLVTYESGYTSNCIVGWSEEANGYRYKNKYNEWFNLYCTRIEIIGNIHENQELMEIE